MIKNKTRLDLITLLYAPFLWLLLIPIDVAIGPLFHQNEFFINLIILTLFFGAFHSAGSTLILLTPLLREWYIKNRLKRIILGVPLVSLVCFLIFYFYAKNYLLYILLFYLLASFYHKQMQSFGILQFFNYKLKDHIGYEVLASVKKSESLYCHFQYLFFCVLILNLLIFKNKNFMILGTVGAIFFGILIFKNSVQLLSIHKESKNRLIFSLRFLGYSLLGLSPFAFVFTSATHALEYYYVVDKSAGNYFWKKGVPTVTRIFSAIYILLVGALFLIDLPVIWSTQSHQLLLEPIGIILASLTFSIAVTNFYIDSIIFRKKTSQGLNLVENLAKLS